jgi:hypothetical protein
LEVEADEPDATSLADARYPPSDREFSFDRDWAGPRETLLAVDYRARYVVEVGVTEEMGGDDEQRHCRPTRRGVLNPSVGIIAGGGDEFIDLLSTDSQ